MTLRVIAILAIAIVGCLVSLRKPFWGLLLLVFWYFFRPDMWGAEAWLRPTQWWSVAVFVGWLLFDRASEHNFRRTGWIVLLMAAMTLSAAFAPLSDAESFERLWLIVKILIIVFLIVKLCNTPQRLAYLTLTILAGILWVSKAVMVHWAQAGLTMTRIDVPVAQGGGANYTCFLFLATLPWLILGLYRRARWQKLLALLCVPIWLLVFVATGSRGGFLALLATMLALLVVQRRLGVYAVGAACALGFLLLAPSAYWQRMSTITTEKTKMDVSELGRWQNIQISLDIIRDYPMLGVGLSKFPQAALKYMPQEYAAVRGVSVAHNTYLQMGAETGLLVLGVFLMTTWALMWRLLRWRSPADMPGRATFEFVRQGLIAGLAGTLTSALFIDAVGLDFFWWLYGLGFACVRVLERQRALAAAPARRSPEAGDKHAPVAPIPLAPRGSEG